ncbi:MAG: hypothetical protein ACRD0P_18935 [Stackebrandtia sp.]
MTETATELERRFRRLLWAYPRRYRRQRGDELLGTLLDSCPDDQSRPTAQQRRSILRSGIGCRFRVRGGRFNVVTTIVLALFCAVIGSCLGSWLSWLSAPDLPDRKATSAIAAEALNGVNPAAVWGNGSKFAYDAEYMEGGSTDPAWLVALLGGDDYGRGMRVADYVGVLSQRQWDTVVPQIKTQLETSGWEVTDHDMGAVPGTPGARSITLTANRDGHALTVTGSSDENYLELMLGREQPSGQTAGLIVGAACGLLAGWLAAVRLAWQMTVRHPRRREVVIGLAMCAFMIGVVPLAASGYIIGNLLVNPDSAHAGGPPWAPLMTFPYRPLCLLAGAMAVAAGLAAMLPNRRRSRRLAVAERSATA